MSKSTAVVDVKKQASVWVTFAFEGIHCYPEAATSPNLEDVSFLGSPHRHQFKVKLTVPVTHFNRDVEFIQLQRAVIKAFYVRVSGSRKIQVGDPIQLGAMSCEMMAEDVYAAFLVALAKLKGTRNAVHPATVEVSEDGENGATVVFG